jgi:hypothetical protein
MAKRAAAGVEVAVEKASQPTQRLCNEIQLFDLCDLEKCGHKQGPYCTSSDLLNRFEAIAEEDERPPSADFISDELDDAEATDDEYDDSFDDDQFGDEGYEGYEEDQ